MCYTKKPTGFLYLFTGGTNINEALETEPDWQRYLQPTLLCDFDREVAIHNKALELTKDTPDKEEKVKQIFSFVREFPYSLEDWDVKASETLRRGWGMCSGKSNLMVAMLRSMGIPSRYRVLRIKSEGNLWRWVTSNNSQAASLMGKSPPEQDHVQVEVYLNGWEMLDPSRDPDFEKGMALLGIPVRRYPVHDTSGGIKVMIFDSFDEWAISRQQQRRFRENRQEVFKRANTQFDIIRSIGRGGVK